MGEIILGMPGPWADDNTESADHYTTKIGGLPDWPFHESIIKPDLLKCDSCKEKLSLVAQIYAPISSRSMTTEERVIYIFSCISNTCETMSWRALRVQRSSHDNKPNISSHNSSASPSITKLQDDPWAFDDEDEDNDEIDLDDLCRALTEATTLASSSKPKKQNTPIDKSSPISVSRTLDDKTKVLPCFYTYTQEEKFLEDYKSLCERDINLLKIPNLKNDGKVEEDWEGESYEYDRTLNADRIYLKFKKHLDVYPDHCFRYSYGGGPLLATPKVGDPGKCLMCGEVRHYEMQLMPPLLYFLQEATKDFSLEKWNWMSVLVYTCSKGCGPVSKQESDGWAVAEEVVVVQSE